MKKALLFLKELQEELNTQDHDCQAAPRFWTVGDYRTVPCPEGYQDAYYISCPNREVYQDINSFLKEVEKELADMSEDAKEDFESIECEDTALDWIREHYDEDAELVPVREEHYVHPNTMFLTKAEAMEHIRMNAHHYSPKAHTYAMTAWRAPKVERLLEILETMDWDTVLRAVEANE